MSHKMPHRNTNESRPYVTLYKTGWSRGGRGEVRTRLIVITFLKKLGYGDYALRWQNYDGATYGGGSFDHVADAYHAFIKKYAAHNEMYKKGNISHLPGLK